MKDVRLVYMYKTLLSSKADPGILCPVHVWYFLFQIYGQFGICCCCCLQPLFLWASKPINSLHAVQFFSLFSCQILGLCAFRNGRSNQNQTQRLGNGAGKGVTGSFSLNPLFIPFIIIVSIGKCPCLLRNSRPSTTRALASDCAFVSWSNQIQSFHFCCRKNWLTYAYI